MVMKNEKKIICVRQISGPLLKECRYVRPYIRKNDDNNVISEKKKIINETKCKCFKRSDVDRLELMLALFGYNSSFYTLTFADDFLPNSFKGVQKVWRTFLKSMRRFLCRPFDYIYCIEGKHGTHRYHIHLVLRNEDFSHKDVGYLWPGGYVDSTSLLKDRNDNFRRVAKYLCKERHDGAVLPAGTRTWVASRSLYKSLPEIERSIVDSDVIHIPDNATWYEISSASNKYGFYRYASYIINAHAHATLT